MRRGAALLMALFGCASSSSTADPAPSGPVCPVTGTYSYLGHLEMGARCSSEPGDAGPVATPTVPVVTVTNLGDYATVEFQGLTGAADIYAVGGCKYQGKAAIPITDALQPNATGTFQFSWTFTAAGFSGITAVTVPPAKSVPQGCAFTSDVVGTRR